MPLDEVLNLDTGAAQRAIDQVERDLTHAAQVFNNGITDALSTLSNLHFDASGLTRSLDAAIEAADTNVVITANAGDVAVTLEGAIDAADANVAVTADASDVTGSIDAAVQAADTHVQISADTQQATEQVDQLDASLANADGSGLSLAAGLKTLFAAGLAKGLFDMVQGASDLAEAQSAANVIFGQSVDVVNEFAQGAATSAGLSKSAALQIEDTFGGLLVALGLSKGAAADLSPDIVQLGADLASFKNIGVEDALEKIRSGLVGEAEPLRDLGVAMNEQLVTQKAMELGLADANGTITEAAKVQARYAIILDQTKVAQGDYARTAGGLANQQRTLNAEFENARIEAGEQLLPVLLELVQSARSDLIPAFTDLASQALPALASILESSIPVASAFVDVLAGAAPILGVVADLLDAIPDPLLATVAAFIALNAATSKLKGLETVDKILKGMPGSAGVAARGIGALGVALIGLEAFAAARDKRGSDFVENILGDTNTSSIEGVHQAVEKIKAELDDLEEHEGKHRLFSIAGANIFATGGDADRQEKIDQLRDKLKDLTDTEEQLTAAESELGKESLTTGDAIAKQYVGAGDALGALNAKAPEVARAIADIRTGAADSDEAFLNLALSLDSASLSEADFAAAAAEMGTDVDSLRQFVEEVTGALNDFVDTAVGQLPTVGDAFQDALSVSQDSIKSQIDSIRSAGDDGAASIRDAASSQSKAITEGASDQAKSIRDAASDRAKAVQDAADKEADAIEKAARSGKNTLTKDSELERAKAIRDGGREQAAAIKDSASDQADALREGASARADRIREGADSEADAIREGATRRAEAIDDDGRVTAAALTRSLDQRAGEIAAFHLRLQALTEGGFADLAGLIAEQGPELGGALAAELADALGRGDTAILQSLRDANDHFNAEFTSATDYLRSTLGPKFILTSGLIGTSAAEAFGKNLDFSERIRISTELAATGLDTAGQAIAAVAAVEGAAAADAYGKALGLDQKTIDAAVAAGNVIRDNAPVGQAQQAGADVGQGYIDGVAYAIAHNGKTIGDALDEQLDDAIAAAKAKAGIESPSTLFAEEIGLPIAQGIASGIGDGSAEVVAEAERIVAAAAAVIGGAPDLRMSAVVGDARAIEHSVSFVPRSTGAATQLIDPRLIAALERLAANPQIGQNIEHVDVNMVTPDPVTSGIAVSRKLQSRANTRRD